MYFKGTDTTTREATPFTNVYSKKKDSAPQSRKFFFAEKSSLQRGLEQTGKQTEMMSRLPWKKYLFLLNESFLTWGGIPVWKLTWLAEVIPIGTWFKTSIGGARTPSIVILFVIKDWRKRGKLFYKIKSIVKRYSTFLCRKWYHL